MGIGGCNSLPQAKSVLGGRGGMMYDKTQCGSCLYHDGVGVCGGSPFVPTHREHPESVRCFWYTSRLTPVADDAALQRALDDLGNSRGASEPVS